jgi:hypothetical protein
VRKAAVRWSARIAVKACGKAETPRLRNATHDEASLTTHTLIMPDAPRHTVHDVALEQAPAESTPAQVRELARVHAKAALNVLVTVMNNTQATESTRVIAAIAVLDRACGKPAPAADDDADQPLRLETIRRIIVRPGHRDSGGLPAAAATGPV